ncbi:SDR family NAD(P)-dependent oxidoreductase [Rhizorhabdus argentea]|uniref:SDR family NAD(P)-dependent oxidoreductase n=1 Tax=Rhizorhabdus argentea TaxID=1387174 RepID=UPI0030ECE6B8
MANIIVVGGAGGLGQAVVAALLAQGDTVSITVLNDAEAASARSATPGISAVHMLDLGDANAVRERLGSVLAQGDAIDGLIVCAAIAPLGPLETTPVNVVRKTLEINTVSSIAIYQAALPVLRETGGRLLFVSSMAGVAAMPFIGAYVTSKFALEGAVDVMRREAAPQGVKVVLVQPGGIRTPMVDAQLIEVADRLAALDAEDSERYGYLYKAFKVMAAESHYKTASSPEAIAATVIEAIKADNPAPRYPAGEDAKQLIALARTGDEQLDQAFAGMFAQAAAAA